MKYISIFLIFLMITFSACETNADVSSLLDTKSFVVINSYISPQDETIRVQVSQSISRFRNNEPSPAELAIVDAEVVIRDTNGNEVQLVFNPEFFHYEISAASYPIMAGETYFLSVRINGKEYTAEATVPLEQVTEVNTDFSEGDSEFDFDEINIRFEDISGRRNFYVVGILFPDGNGSTFFDEGQFVTDANRDGGLLTGFGEIDFFTGDPETEIPYTIQVANVERILYDVLRIDYLFGDIEDDILVEPVVSPNNIVGEGAIGVFAGYNLTEQDEVFIP